jgi:hypothetical protein
VCSAPVPGSMWSEVLEDPSTIDAFTVGQMPNEHAKKGYGLVGTSKERANEKARLSTKGRSPIKEGKWTPPPPPPNPQNASVLNFDWKILEDIQGCRGGAEMRLYFGKGYRVTTRKALYPKALVGSLYSFPKIKLGFLPHLYPPLPCRNLL